MYSSIWSIKLWKKAEFIKNYISYDFIPGVSTWAWIGEITGKWAIGFANGSIVISWLEKDDGIPSVNSIISILR